MAITQIGFTNFSGLAADTKPTIKIGVGSTFYETDTKKTFVFDGLGWTESSSGGSGALFQFNYQWKLAVDASPPTHYMSRDNATTASITKLYVNKVDATGHDMSLFLSEITAGDDLTLHDHNDADIYIAFTASAAATLTGNTFTIPVTFVKQNGADFTDNESVNIHWVSESKSVTAPSGLERVGDSYVYPGTLATSGIPAFYIDSSEGDVSSNFPAHSQVVLVGSPTQSNFYAAMRHAGFDIATSRTFLQLASLIPAKDYTGVRLPFNYKLIDNPSVVTGDGTVNLMPTGDAPQHNMTYIEGVKYRSYRSFDISLLLNSELGTFLFDSTLNLLVQCTDATAGANVWTPVGGGSAEKGGIAHSDTTDYVVGDIVAEAGKVYSCKKTHIAKSFDATEWKCVIISQTQPIIPADISPSPTQAEVQAVLDYSKNISTSLVAAGVFK